MNSITSHISRDGPYVSALYFTGALFRLNYDYRARVAEYVHTFRSKNKLKTTDRCIAFHIRRGDRVIAGKNMLDHCQWIRDLCNNQTRVSFGDCAEDGYEYYSFG